MFVFAGEESDNAELFQGSRFNAKGDPHGLCATIAEPISQTRSRTSNFFSPPLANPRTNRPGRRQYLHSKWVAFTATERAYQPPPSPTRATLLRGSRPLPSRSLSRSRSSRRRAPLPPSKIYAQGDIQRHTDCAAGLVRSFVTLTVSPRPRASSTTLTSSSMNANF